MVQDHARLTLPGRRSRAVIAVAVVGFVALLFAWPMGALLRRAGTRSGFSDVVTDPHLRAVWWFTTWQAVLSGALAMLLGLPMAWLVSSSDTSVTRLIRGLATAAFVLPPVVVAIAMLRAVPGLGHEGVVPLVVAHAYVNLAVVIRVVGARWEVLDHDPTDAARLLGASPLRAFVTTTVPALGSAIVTAATTVFLFCFTSFGIAKILAGPRRPTIEIEIANQASRLLRFDRAAGLAVTQTVMVILLLVVLGRSRRHQGGGRPGVPSRRPRHKALVRCTAVASASLIAWPLIALVIRSVHLTGGWTLDGFRHLGVRFRSSPLPHTAWQSLAVSAKYATITALLASIGGVAAAAVRSRIVHAAVLVPLGSSAVALGLGMLLAFPSGVLGSGDLVIPLAHCLVGLPLVVRMITPVIESIDPDERAAAALCGARPWRVWMWIDRPRQQRAAFAAAALAAAISMGEFGAASFLARSDAPTAPLAIERLLSRPGVASAQTALALSVILAATVIMLAVTADRLARPPQ